MSPSDDSVIDSELVDRTRPGDREAFADIADAIYDHSYEIARRILGESHLAQDPTQQAMLSIWRDWPNLRDAARFDGWSRRILLRARYAESAGARRTIHTAPSLASIASSSVGVAGSPMKKATLIYDGSVPRRSGSCQHPISLGRRSFGCWSNAGSSQSPSRNCVSPPSGS